MSDVRICLLSSSAYVKTHSLLERKRRKIKHILRNVFFRFNTKHAHTHSSLSNPYAKNMSEVVK